MPRRRGKVLLDPSDLERDTKKLLDGLREGGLREARAAAERTADRTRAATPVRTGLLASTVGVSQAVVFAPGLSGADAYAWGVTYGGGLRYAGSVERRKHPVRKGARGAKREFQEALNQLAASEISKL